MRAQLDVLFHGAKVGTLTLLPGEKTVFEFEQSYINNPDRPVISQSFYTQSGELQIEYNIVQTKVPSFFSNVLPEGHLRAYWVLRCRRLN